MIREVCHEDIPACVNLIKQSFKTVADEFGLTEENAPRFTAFANNLAVLPEHRHKGIGKMLLEHSYTTARDNGSKIMNIGIVEENKILRKWYEDNGAVHVGTQKFDFFPFTCGYLKKEL